MTCNNFLLNHIIAPSIVNTNVTASTTTIDQTKCYSCDLFDPPARKQQKIPTSRGLTATNAHVGITMFALVPVATLSRTPATSVLKHYNYTDFNIINYAYFNILMTYNYIVLMFFVITTLSLIFWWLNYIVNLFKNKSNTNINLYKYIYIYISNILKKHYKK